jgi:DnaJ-class molecular chaperone
MPIQFKDYYEVLKVPYSASETEIKSAYRKLARRHHPDLFSIGLKKSAEEKFKTINEAYEVLRDEEKREKYDELYTHWKNRTSFRSSYTHDGKSETKKRKTWKAEDEVREHETARATPRRWDHEEERKPEGRHASSDKGQSFSDFFQSLFGTEDEEEDHEKGHGSHKDDDSHHDAGHPQPGGDIESEILLTLEEVAEGTKRHIRVPREIRCLFCQGKGWLGRDTCARCKGAGRITEEKELSVTIPSGVRDGDKIRLSGQGGLGVGGGNPGDRYILVKFQPHSQYKTTADHLEMDLDVMPWEAALGAELKIKTLSGNVILKIPEGTRNGQQFRLRGKGLPVRKADRQDLYVRIHINIASALTAEERQHYVELARLAKQR